MVVGSDFISKQVVGSDLMGKLVLRSDIINELSRWSDSDLPVSDGILYNDIAPDRCFSSQEEKITLR